ncbi:MAG: helix-turn-helix domain-containing protein [Candidatus Aenigmarchaeota archaeon]|nr:helix-turn-helix domain-containing protein [Candidatus Aenigmarchaeota archaeon]
MRAILAFSVVAVLAFCAAGAAADSSGDYYADLDIDVSNTGHVTISGITNHPELESGTYDIYTSKSGAYWILNITHPEIFADYVYTLYMPSESTINYIRASGSIAIKKGGDRIMIEGVGNHEEFFIVVQYSTDPPDYSGYLWSLAIPALFAVLIAVRYRFRKRHTPRRYDPMMLSKRQLAIVSALEKNGKPMTQHQLEEALSLPKSSVSRNVATLVKSGILTKHSQGMSNSVWFSEK